MITRAYIYCRVSSQRQVDEGHGLDGQEKRCSDFAKNRGYEVVKVFRDEGVSGGIVEREGMQALLNELDNHLNEEMSVVIIDDIKRFARDVQGHFLLKTAIYSRNARLESPSHRFEDTPEGKFVETVLAGAAELERNQNRRQVINRMKARLENGYWPFMPPLGLINKKDSLHGKVLIPHEPYASVLKKAIEKYRDGVLLTKEEVMRFLHQEFAAIGLPNRPALSSTQEMLKDPLYAGYISYEKWGISFMKARHEGIVSFETYNLVQERLQSRAKPWKRRDYSIDFPLRPYVRCASCGEPMTGSWNTGRSAKYPNYKCRRNKAFCVFGQKTINKYKFENKFEELLVQVKPPEEHIDLAKDVLQEQWSIRVEQQAAHREFIKKEFLEASEGIEWYAELIGKTRDAVIIATYENKIKELTIKKRTAESELAKQAYTPKQFGTASEKVLNTLKNPMSMWKSEYFNDKRTILFMYFEGQLKYDYERGFGTANLAYPIKLINELGQAKKPSVEMSDNESESEKY